MVYLSVKVCILLKKVYYKGPLYISKCSILEMGEKDGPLPRSLRCLSFISNSEMLITFISPEGIVVDIALSSGSFHFFLFLFLLLLYLLYLLFSTPLGCASSSWPRCSFSKKIKINDRMMWFVLTTWYLAASCICFRRNSTSPGSTPTAPRGEVKDLSPGSVVEVPFYILIVFVNLRFLGVLSFLF